MISSFRSLDQAKRPFFVGVDVGGTSIKIGLVDDDGAPLAKTSFPTESRSGPEVAVDRIRKTIERLLAEHGVNRSEVRSLGLGTPGTMDIPKGMILEPPNMPGWRRFPIRDRVSRACDLPVSFVNDANAAAFGEYWIGTGREFSSMIMLTLGTGVGGGIIVDGKPIEGVNSFGSECGHIIVDSRPDARLCAWGGGRGELEAYASAPAVSGRMRELLDEGRASSVGTRVDSGEELTSLMVSEEAERGDALAIEVVLETARHLGVGIVTLVHTIDPGLVVLGGAMNFGGHETDVGRRFLEEVRREFRRRAFDVVSDTTVIDFARLGTDAGYVGAAGVARAAVVDR